jgi:DnaJ like chaperone protein
MGIGKWIGGILGWTLAGPFGALLGVGIASLFEKGSGSYFSQQTPQYNNFMVSLLILSSSVMKADGRVLRSELEYVKNFIRANFGEEAVADALRILKELLQKDVNIEEVGAQITINVPISQRLQLSHYLCGIAKADGVVSQAEMDILRRIAAAMRIPSQDAESMFAMYGSSVEDAYKVLEIERTATDDEVKKAYRRMAMKHHPDKVATLGDDVKKAAEEKFKKISEAYDKIKKERGLN